MAELGDVLGGRYRLDELIGRGGMASVYRAWDVPLGRSVALKLLRPELLADPDLALRFRREAHAATVLRHPNVVACLDTGREGDQPYLVMDLVEGEDLTTRLRRDGALPPSLATRIAIDVARGLSVAHARGVVHRDVKPGNILLGTDGRARVTDFGIARLAAEAEATLPGTTLGSVHYFSPEQAQGLTTTPASDVYSLGLVMFEMLTGTRPFAGESPAEIALARVDAPAPSPRAVSPDVPPALDAIVRRALSPDPRDRYPNGGAIAAELETLGKPVDTGSPTTVHRIAGLVPTPAALRDRRAPGFAADGRAVPVAAALAVLLVLAGGLSLFLLFGRGDGATAIPPGDETGAPASTAPAIAEPVTTDSPTEPPLTAEPEPPATPVPDGQVADLCEPPTGESCPLPPGRYITASLEPPAEFAVGEGWSAVLVTDEMVVLGRPEGYLALAVDVATVFDEGEPVSIRPSARRLIDAVGDNDDLDILDEGRVRVAGRNVRQLDLAPDGDERVPLFTTSQHAYYAETGTVTRLLAFDIRGTSLLIVLEGANGVSLEVFLDIAGGVLDSLSFR